MSGRRVMFGEDGEEEMAYTWRVRSGLLTSSNVARLLRMSVVSACKSATSLSIRTSLMIEVVGSNAPGELTKISCGFEPRGFTRARVSRCTVKMEVLNSELKKDRYALLTRCRRPRS